MKVLGDGAIVKRENKERKDCRKWTLRVRTDCGIKEKRFTGTYTQAKKALDDYKSEITLDISNIKFNDYAKQWYTRRERQGEIAPSTMEKDRNLLRVLCKQFGNMRLAEISRSDAIDGLLDIKEANGYSNTYHSELHVKFKSLLTSARKDGLININVLQDEPTPKRNASNRQAVPVDDVRIFLERLALEPLSSRIVAAYIAVLSGARRGEIVGFTWDDVDLTNGIMHVRRSIMDTGKPKAPKSMAGFRSYPIMSTLHDVLIRWQRIQEQQLKLLGLKQTVDTSVIANDRGGIMNPQNLDRWWRQNRDRFGLPGVVLHELRHTYLTMLANSGAPSKVLQDVAGWSSIFEADTYVHSDMAAQKAAVDALENSLRSRGVK